MKVDILIEGEPDIRPIAKSYHYEKNDEFIFFDSIKIIKNKIQKNLRLNINETLALYVWYTVSSLKEGKTPKDIVEIASQVLLPHQVLIGVPELLQKITISVTVDKTFKLLVLEKPIPQKYFFPDQKEQIV